MTNPHGYPASVAHGWRGRSPVKRARAARRPPPPHANLAMAFLAVSALLAAIAALLALRLLQPGRRDR